MITVITETTVKPGQEQEWDRAYQARIDDARRQPGWIDAQLLIPEGEQDRRVVVGTWRERSDWEQWHLTPVFRQTRGEMNAATRDDGQVHFYELKARHAREG
ncbi:MAG TPA: antibiotic biosynthesis monooxygenase family protein [Thermomicrobiaceae bacterium]|nr:antibiotic biosynthesis monooxygenase family protein [Thermomicrobiaceae bacterium]